ncbi:MAG: Ig-like domain-containing protein [Chlorobium sp.]
MATYTKTGTIGSDVFDLFTISGISGLPVNGDTYVFDGLAGSDMLTLSVGGAYLGAFLSSNFAIPATPDASGQYVISGTIMSDIMVTLKLTGVEQLVFADKVVSLSYPGSIDATPPTVVVFNPLGISTSSSINVTFSEAIQKGTGFVEIQRWGNVLASYNVATSSNLTISGSTITIRPATTFSANNDYSVIFSPGSIKDLAGNGCIGTTEYDFNTNLASPFMTSSQPQIGFGKVATDFGGGYDFGANITTQADGKILVTGSSINCGSMDVALVRYNADGSLDTSFGAGQGKITTDFGYGDISLCLSQPSSLSDLMKKEKPFRDKV